ncbi:MAG: hypothetical protein OEZ58_23425 [Gammaproteobacteria bacterium]|nr:hypothetical protein [Gammaproteobacteria bacterium]MDH5731946.1 hypothetical protein [Gammaproteobacteria bacterium]
MKKLSVLILGCLLVLGCSQSPKKEFLPMVRDYQPLEWELTAYEQARKDIFPSDLQMQPKIYKNKLVNLVGIIKDIEFDQKFSNIVTITLEQKYWDYLEHHYSTPTIHLSSEGEGEFKFRYELPYAIPQHIQAKMRVSVMRKDLGFVYGHLSGFENNIPILSGKTLRVVHAMHYDSEHQHYIVKRNTHHQVILQEGQVQFVYN